MKSVKRLLHKTVGRGRLSIDELQTAVTEVEMIVNSQPLLYLFIRQNSRTDYTIAFTDRSSDEPTKWPLQ